MTYDVYGHLFPSLEDDHAKFAAGELQITAARTTEVAGMPILRPLIGTDKEEIIREARAIGTYEISIEPDQDCCTLLTPRRVETRARIDDLRRIEGRLDADDLAEELALSAQEYRQ